MTESDLEQKAVERIRARGGYVLPKQWLSPATKRGVPDRIICFRGRFVALEFKHPKLNVRGVDESNDYHGSEAQRRHLGSIRAAGGTAYVVNSLAQVDMILDRVAVHTELS